MLSLLSVVLLFSGFVVGLFSALRWKELDEMDRRNIGRDKLFKKALVFTVLAVLMVVSSVIIQPTRNCMFGCGTHDALSN